MLGFDVWPLRRDPKVPGLVEIKGVEELDKKGVEVEKNGLRVGESSGDGEAGVLGPGEGVDGSREDFRGRGGRERRAWMTNLFGQYQRTSCIGKGGLTNG